MSVHFDESKSTVGLQAGFQNVTKVLEKGNQVILRRIRCKVAHIACCLPLRGLLDNHVIALDTMSGKMMVTERRGRGHAHGCHSLLLRDRRLALLVGPVAANGAGTKPFSIHGGQSLVRI